MHTIEKIQQEISKEIKQSCLSQTKIAKQIKVNQHTISRYANCQNLPSLEIFAMLCELLELDPNEILGL